MLVWPVFIGFLVWGFVVVRGMIRNAEGSDGAPTEGRAFKEGWATASGLERVAFITMAFAAFMWTFLILFIPWAVAMGAVVWLAWNRPYLQVTLGRLLVLYGIAAMAASALSWRGDGDLGAISVNAIVFGLLPIVPGLLLLLANRPQPDNSATGDLDGHN